MDLRALRQRLYIAALQSALTAQQQSKRGAPGAAHLQIIAADELAWINCLSVEDLTFLKVQKIAP